MFTNHKINFPVNKCQPLSQTSVWSRFLDGCFKYNVSSYFLTFPVKVIIVSVVKKQILTVKYNTRWISLFVFNYTVRSKRNSSMTCCHLVIMIIRTWCQCSIYSNGKKALFVSPQSNAEFRTAYYYYYFCHRNMLMIGRVECGSEFSVRFLPPAGVESDFL